MSFQETSLGENRWLFSSEQLNQLYIMQCELNRMEVQLDVYKREMQHIITNQHYGDKYVLGNTMDAKLLGRTWIG
jgi:hypothetical protein